MDNNGSVSVVRTQVHLSGVLLGSFLFGLVVYMINIPVSAIPMSSVSSMQNMSSGEFLTYTNTTEGITFKFPSDWTRYNLMGANIFRSPLDESDFFSENFVVIAQPIPQNFTSNGVVYSLNITLDKVVDMNLANMSKLPSSDFEIIESTPFNLVGNSAYKIVYRYALPLMSTGDLAGMQIFTIRDDKVYQIIFTSEAERLNDYMPIFQTILDSLRFTNP